MEKENPEAMLESDELKEVESGAVDIRCSVCHAASKVAYNRAAKRRLLLDEEGTLKLMRLSTLQCHTLTAAALCTVVQA